MSCGWDHIDEWMHVHQAVMEGSTQGKAVDFWRWQREVAEQVLIGSYTAIGDGDREEQLRLYIETTPPQIKACYETAVRVSMLTGCDYVEGWACGFIPVQHAWNAVGDHHFDLTDEVALAGLDDHPGLDSHYIKVLRLTPKEVACWMMRTRQSGDFMTPYWVETVLGEKWR